MKIDIFVVFISLNDCSDSRYSILNGIAFSLSNNMVVAASVPIQLMLNLMQRKHNNCVKR